MNHLKKLLFLLLPPFYFLMNGCGLPAGPNTAPTFATIASRSVILTPNTSVDSFNPQIAVDGSNRIFIAWQDNVGTGNINYAYSNDGGSTFNNLGAVAGGSYPRIATDGSNNVYILGYSNGNIFLNYALSNSFKPSFQISTTSVPIPQNPEPQADVTFGAGTLFMTWMQSSSVSGCVPSCYDILYDSPLVPLNTLSFATTPTTVLHDTAFADYPRIVQSGGNPSIVYLQTSVSDLVLSSFTTTSSIQTSFQVKTSNVSKIPLSSSLGIDGSGNRYVAWEANRSQGGVDIFFNYLKAGTSLFNSNPQDLSNNGNSKGPVVGIDSSQYLYVAFFSRTASNTGAYDVFLERSTDGGKTFSGALNISNTPGDSISYAPGMAIIGKSAYLVWDDNSNTGGNHQIYFQKVTLN